MSNNEVTEIGVELLRETEKAYLVRYLKTDEEAFFPKSQVIFTYFNHKKMKGSMEVPDWLLEKKGWL
jgi:hypothetical protein